MKQNSGFLGMLLGTVDKSLLQNILVGKGVIRTDDGVIRVCNTVIRVRQDF